MTDEQREAIEAGAKTMEWVATMPNSAMLRYAIVLRSMLATRPAPSPTDAAFGKGIPTSLEVAWDDFAQRKGLAPHSVNAYAVEFARERCADLQAQFRAHVEQAPYPSDAAVEPKGNDAQLRVFYYDMWTQARERYQKAEQRIKELDAMLKLKQDDWIEVCKELDALKSPSPSREGWLTRKEVEDIIEGHVIGESDWRSLCDMALSALRPAAGGEK